MPLVLLQLEELSSRQGLRPQRPVVATEHRRVPVGVPPAGVGNEVEGRIHAHLPIIYAVSTEVT